MLSEQELQQICRSYEIVCPVCSTSNHYYRLKRDMARAATSEGDGHPTKWKWGKPRLRHRRPETVFHGVLAANADLRGNLTMPTIAPRAKTPKASRRISQPTHFRD